MIQLSHKLPFHTDFTSPAVHMCALFVFVGRNQRVRSIQDNLHTITYINSADNASVVLYYRHQFYWCC